VTGQERPREGESEAGGYVLPPIAVGLEGLSTYLASLPARKVASEVRPQRLRLGDVDVPSVSHGLFFPAFLDFVVAVARQRAATDPRADSEWVKTTAFNRALPEHRALGFVAVEGMQDARLAELRRRAAEQSPQQAQPTRRPSFPTVIQPYLDKSAAFRVAVELHQTLADTSHFGAAEIMANVGYTLAAMHDSIEGPPVTAAQTAGGPTAAAA
jgi:hypothetical protein